MRVWLVINEFLKTEKFNEIYKMLTDALYERGYTVEIKTNAQLIYNGDTFINDVGDLPDRVIFWDKDILLARFLEKIGLKVYNSSFSIEMSDDKALTYTLLKKNNIPTPETVFCPMTYENIGYKNIEAFIEPVAKKLGFPFIIKECKGSFGKGVYLAENLHSAKNIIENTNKPLIFQKFIKECMGEDIRINVVGKKCVASMLRKSKDDFRANITLGGTAFDYEPTQQEKALALECASAFDLTFGGIDILRTNNGPVICEVNSNAHFKSIYDCTGVNVGEEIAKII